jgi:hypothetical protein
VAPADDFAFWAGEWDVFTPDGQQVGTNQITAIFGGRVLSERWVGASGVEGASLSSWDADRGRWHQTWMDSTGSTLLLDGALVDGAMVLEGDSPGEQPGTSQRNRISWTVIADDTGSSDDQPSVRQLWEVSEDAGGTWTVAFDGRYQRAAVPSE